MPFEYQPSTPEREKRYEYFQTRAERQDLYNASKRLAEILRSENIPNVVILDRSSRPAYMGLKEYWQQKYPGEKMASIYFMNPKGFKAKDYIDALEAARYAEECSQKGESWEPVRKMRNRDEISAEVEGLYKNLLRDKDKPVLLLDTCIHTGNSIRPIIETLKDIGFADVRTAVVDTEDAWSEIQPDYSLLDGKEPLRGCYPFDHDRLVEKTFECVHSVPTDSRMKLEEARERRKEIRQIIKDCVESDKGEEYS